MKHLQVSEIKPNNKNMMLFYLELQVKFRVRLGKGFMVMRYR